MFSYEIENGWYISPINKNCDTACKKHGLICSKNELHSHNLEVDSSGELLRLIRQSGGSTAASVCSGAYGSEPDVPVFNAEFCLYSSSSRSIATFNCSRVSAPEAQQKHRLCYCHSVV